MILNTINIQQGQQKHPCDQNGEMSQGDFEKKKKPKTTKQNTTFYWLQKTKEHCKGV
jgi:hypothetical protein